jgi:hypothetical protein
LHGQRNVSTLIAIIRQKIEVINESSHELANCPAW